jgi:hypothetical protein
MRGLKVFLLCTLLVLSAAGCSSTGKNQLPNPIVEYNSLEDVQKAVDFAFKPPGHLPEGFSVDSFSVINKEIAQVLYKKGENRICYRAAKGSDDISGDYNVYPVKSTITVGGSMVVLKGAGERVNLAVWEKGGLCFALSFDEAVALSVVEQMILSVS